MTAHIILDIDGVLSPEGAVADSTRIDLSEANDWVNWQTSQELLAWLQELLTRADVRWGSSWEHESDLFTAALGLPVLPHLVFWNNNNSSTDEWYKFKAVADFVLALPADDLIIWVDDELDATSQERITAFHPRVRTVKPHSRIGLSDQERDHIFTLIEQDGK